MRRLAAPTSTAVATLAALTLAPIPAVAAPTPVGTTCGAVVHVGPGDDSALKAAYSSLGIDSGNITILEEEADAWRAVGALVRATETEAPTPGGRCWVAAVASPEDVDAIAENVPHDERVLWIEAGSGSLGDSTDAYAQTSTSKWSKGSTGGEDFARFAADELGAFTAPADDVPASAPEASSDAPAPEAPAGQPPASKGPDSPAPEAAPEDDGAHDAAPSPQAPAAAPTDITVEVSPAEDTPPTPPGDQEQAPAEDQSPSLEPAGTTGFNMDRASGGGAVRANDWKPDEVWAFDIRSRNPDFLTGDYIDAWLKERYSDSPLIGHGDYIVEMSEKTGISAGFALGNWAKETTFGRNKPGAAPHFNFGCMTGPTVKGAPTVNIANRDWVSFGTAEAGIKGWFEYVKKGYVDEGKTTYKDFLDKYSPASDNNDHATFGNIMWGVLDAVGYDLSQKAPIFDGPQ